jgi:xanthine/uracil/vitamin C permease (AzgA family)
MMPQQNHGFIESVKDSVEKYFRIEERRSSIAQELRAGKLQLFTAPSMLIGLNLLSNQL